MGEQGKLTGTDLINALLSQQRQVDEVFQKIPITVGQSLALIDNAWTRFIGESNKAYGVTQTLAGGFASLSRHIPELVEGALQLASIYGVKLTAGLAAYVDGQLQAAASRVAVAAAA